MICDRKKCSREIPKGAIYCPFCGKKQAVQEVPLKRRRNGNGTVYFDSRRGWTFRIRTNGRDTSKGGFKSREEAEEALNKYASAACSEEPLTVEEAYALLIETERFKELSYNKRIQYKTAFSRLRSVRKRPVIGLKYAELQKLIDRIATGYYPKRDVKSLLMKIYVLTKRRGENVNVYVIKDLELPRNVPVEKRGVITRREMKAIIEDYCEMRDAVSLVAGTWIVMLFTGMRPGELRTVDMNNLHLYEDFPYIVGGIKTKAGIDREIPIMECIIPIVKSLQANARRGLMPWSDEKKYYEDCKELIRRTGIRENVTPYWCRHTFASMLEDAGTSMYMKKRLMGHSTSDITDEYTHTTIEQKYEAVQNALMPFIEIFELY